MGWFDTTITDWIIAITNIGIAGAASKAVLDVMPEWRKQKDAEAWNSTAEAILKAAVGFGNQLHLAASQIEGGIRSRTEHGRATRDWTYFPQVKIITPEELGPHLVELLGYMEIGSRKWSGDTEEKGQALNRAFLLYVKEYGRLETIFYRCGQDELLTYEKEVQGRGKDSRSRVLLACEEALEAVKKDAAKNLFGSREYPGPNFAGK